MNIEQVPELYGNHLESGTSVAFHAKNTDTYNSGNITVGATDPDITVILISVT